MKVLLWYMLWSFCVIIVTGSRVQVTMNGPISRCPDFDADKSKIDLTGLQFIQTSDYDFILSGKYIIKETIDGPMALRITSKKYERGTWVNSVFNQNIQDVCKELEKPKRPDWMKIFDDWTVDKKCPFIPKEGEFEDVVFFNSQRASALMPPNFYGKYKSESRFQKIVDGEMVDIDCYIVHFEMNSA